MSVQPKQMKGAKMILYHVTTNKKAKNIIRAVLYRLIFLTLGGVIFENRRDIIGVEL